MPSRVNARSLSRCLVLALGQRLANLDAGVADVAEPFVPIFLETTPEQRPDSRAVWAIVVAGDEATAVRLSGPKAAVDRHYPAFEAWLKAIK